jgi:hypothetical protein
MTSMWYYIMMQSEDDLAGAKSESNINTIEYLLDKDLPQYRRKISEFTESPIQRDNFVLSHRAETYTVFRVYIESIDSSKVRLYYSKFEPVHKDATLCIIHGYSQSTDNFIEVTIS